MGSLLSFWYLQRATGVRVSEESGLAAFVSEGCMTSDVALDLGKLSCLYSVPLAAVRNVVVGYAVLGMILNAFPAGSPFR